VNALGDTYVLMLAGVDYVCPCVPEPPTWEHTFDFVNTADGWTLLEGTTQPDYLLSVHNSGLNEESLQIEISWASPRTITHFDATVYFTNTRLSTLKEVSFFDGTASPGVLVANWDVTALNQPVNVAWDGVRVGKTYFRFRNVSRNAAANRLYQIRVAGEGTDPF